MLFLIAAMIISLSTETKHVANIYPATMEVVALERETDTVVIEDSNGFQFAFYGIEDYNVNDFVSVLLSDNGTVEITDDIILDVDYSGYNRKEIEK